MKIPTSLLCAVAGLLVGCEFGPPAEALPSTNGERVPIIHNHANASGRSRWAAIEEVRVTSSAGGEGFFSSVRHVDVDAKGQLYVLAPGEDALLVFTRAGRLARTIHLDRTEHCGEGSALSFWWDRDSAIVVRYPACYARFSGDGVHLGNRSAGAVANVPPYRATVSTAGDILEIVSEARREPSGDRTWSLHPIVSGRDGVDTFPAVRTIVKSLPGTSIMDPATPRPILYIDPGGTLWFSSARDYRVYARSLEGDTVLAFTSDASPTALSDEERSELARTWAEDTVLPESVLPDVHQAVVRITSDRQGRVIVFPHVDGRSAGGLADVFANGVFEGRIELPYSVEVQHHVPVLWGDHLVGVTKDARGRSAIVRLRIVEQEGR